MTKVRCELHGCFRLHEECGETYCWHGVDPDFICPIKKAMNNPDISDLELGTIVTMVEKCLREDDEETNHENADDILCEFLKRLGYENIVEVYELISKWYS
jgi:hypothetical protein